MNQYSSYKDSGVEWVGSIPREWDIIRGRFIFTRRKEINKGMKCDNLLQLTMKGVLNKDFKSSDGLRPDNYETYQIFEKNDLVFKLIDLENYKTSRVGLVFEKGIMSPVYIRLETNPPHQPRFFFHQFYDLYKQGIYNVLGDGVRSSLTPSDLLEIPLVVPSITEQHQIVEYLDNKTSSIDSLIQSKEKKIELLKEKRTSLINQVVTKGLNPDVEMKDSGVEWIGEIPKGWEVSSLKYISEVLPSNVDKHIYPDEIQVKLCNYTDVYYNDYITREVELKNGSCNQNEYNKFQIRVDDVIITKDSESPDDIGIPTIVKDQLVDVVCGYHLTMLRPHSINGRFLFRFIQSNRTRRYFEINSSGITRYSLGKSTIENLSVPIPPLTEQQDIVSYLDKETKLIDETISSEQKKIELLKEYKQSLISEVVTGKRKVVD